MYQSLGFVAGVVILFWFWFTSEARVVKAGHLHHNNKGAFMPVKKTMKAAILGTFLGLASMERLRKIIIF